MQFKLVVKTTTQTVTFSLKEVRECAYLVEKCRIMLGSLRKHEEVVVLENNE